MHSAAAPVLVALCAVLSVASAEPSPCAALPCRFDDGSFHSGLCNWRGSEWKRAGDDGGEHVAVDGRAAAAHGLATLRSVPIDVSAGTFFTFRYWLASYNAELRLCADKPSCACPGAQCLWSARFDAAYARGGPVKQWRPCERRRGGWQCRPEDKVHVSLPEGRRTLYFVARDVTRHASVALDEFAVSVDGRPCDHAAKLLLEEPAAPTTARRTRAPRTTTTTTSATSTTRRTSSKRTTPVATTTSTSTRATPTTTRDWTSLLRQLTLRPTLAARRPAAPAALRPPGASIFRKGGAAFDRVESGRTRGTTGSWLEAVGGGHIDVQTEAPFSTTQTTTLPPTTVQTRRTRSYTGTPHWLKPTTTAPPPPVTASPPPHCFLPPRRTYYGGEVLHTLVEYHNWDGDLWTCQKACLSRKDCLSITYILHSNPTVCTLQASQCSDERIDCDDGRDDAGYYYENIQFQFELCRLSPLEQLFAT